MLSLRFAIAGTTTWRASISSVVTRTSPLVARHGRWLAAQREAAASIASACFSTA